MESVKQERCVKGSCHLVESVSCSVSCSHNVAGLSATSECEGGSLCLNVLSYNITELSSLMAFVLPHGARNAYC